MSIVNFKQSLNWPNGISIIIIHDLHEAGSDGYFISNYLIKEVTGFLKPFIAFR